MHYFTSNPGNILFLCMKNSLYLRSYVQHKTVFFYLFSPVTIAFFSFLYLSSTSYHYYPPYSSLFTLPNNIKIPSYHYILSIILSHFPLLHIFIPSSSLRDILSNIQTSLRPLLSHILLDIFNSKSYILYNYSYYHLYYHLLLSYHFMKYSLPYFLNYKLISH